MLYKNIVCFIRFIIKQIMVEGIAYCYKRDK